jgi:CRISPR-associated protein Cas1
MNRIIDVCHDKARLSCKLDNLVIEARDETQLIPFKDIAALVLSSQYVLLTQPVLSSLSCCNVVVIVCDERHIPCGMVLPLSSHYAQAQIFDIQARLSVPSKIRVWRSLVKAKILAQAKVLTLVHGEDFGLSRMAQEVKSGDTTNVEGKAARRYWVSLFHPDFKRDFQSPDENSLLNYGYALIRGLVARALCASGLHPCLGIHHHHRSNPFALADDFIEPLRPFVDYQVWCWVSENGIDKGLTREGKVFLLSRFVDRYAMGGQYRTLFSGLNQMASSFVKVCRGEQIDISIPSPLSFNSLEGRMGDQCSI